MTIRAASPADHDAIWEILEPVIRAGDTYTFPLDWTREQAIAFWFSEGHSVFIAEDDGHVAGAYFLRPNQQGGGSHVANCGYVTAGAATGRGIAKAMCGHSMAYASSCGFLAMQFNFVISTNKPAIAAWKTMGFEVVGTLPSAFKHPRLGFVDAFVMYRLLRGSPDTPSPAAADI